jgi:hypothetical protein
MGRKRNVLITLGLSLAIVSFSFNTVYASVSPPFKFVTPWIWETPPNLTIESPTVNGTYTGSVMLNFTIEKTSYWFNNQSSNWNEFNQKNTAIEQKLISVTYILDDYLTTIPVDSNLCVPYKSSIELANLTEGTHQLILSTNATGVYRSFRGYFAQTQIYNSNKTAIVFNFSPAPSDTPTSTSANQLVHSYYADITIVILSLVALLVSILIYRKHQKHSTLNK